MVQPYKHTLGNSLDTPVLYPINPLSKAQSLWSLADFLLYVCIWKAEYDYRSHNSVDWFYNEFINMSR